MEPCHHRRYSADKQRSRTAAEVESSSSGGTWEVRRPAGTFAAASYPVSRVVFVVVAVLLLSIGVLPVAVESFPCPKSHYRHVVGPPPTTTSDASSVGGGGVQLRCVPCSSCPSNHIVRRPCGRTADTVCGPFYEFEFFNQRTPSPPSSSSSSSELERRQGLSQVYLLDGGSVVAARPKNLADDGAKADGLDGGGGTSYQSTTKTGNKISFLCDLTLTIQMLNYNVALFYFFCIIPSVKSTLMNFA